MPPQSQGTGYMAKHPTGALDYDDAPKMQEGCHREAINEIVRPFNELDRPNIIRNITIQQLNYGYIVQVGCHSFAIENAAQLITKLSAYILQPAETEKLWQEGKLF